VWTAFKLPLRCELRRGPATPGRPTSAATSKRQLVDELELHLQADLKLMRDKNELRPGDWISSFMKEIGRADLVVVVLSDRYLRSIYMREMLYLFQQSQVERGRRMRKLVPLKVGELSISRAKDPRRQIFGRISFNEPSNRKYRASPRFTDRM
jgi:TIR domain